jgi:molybdopterin-guanine dinucleotide biosynthesis protein A
VTASGGREHYTTALWPVALRDDLRAWLEAGERRVGAFIARHGASVVEWPVEPVDPFLNLNAPEDWAQAEAADRAIRARQRG